MAKINISIDDELLERLDNVADRNYLTRSGLITTACVQYINQSELLLTIKDLSVCMRKIADNGSVDQETLDRLNELQNFYKVATGN